MVQSTVGNHASGAATVHALSDRWPWLPSAGYLGALGIQRGRAEPRQAEQFPGKLALHGGGQALEPICVGDAAGLLAAEDQAAIA
jgi:hypothetical protein